MMFSWTEKVEKSSYHDQDFPVIVRNELMSLSQLVLNAPVPEVA